MNPGQKRRGVGTAVGGTRLWVDLQAASCQIAWCARSEPMDETATARELGRRG